MRGTAGEMVGVRGRALSRWRKVEADREGGKWNREGGAEDVCATDRKATFSMVSYRRDQAPACAYRFCPP